MLRLASRLTKTSYVNVARQYVAVRHTSTEQSQEKYVKKPRDEQINLPMVQLVDPVTSKLLSPESPSDILSRIDFGERHRGGHYIVRPRW